jgi:hypothetical protein
MNRRITLQEVWIIFQTSILLYVISAPLKLMGLRRTRYILSRLSRSRGVYSTESGSQVASKVASLVDLACRHHRLGSNCLRRSLVLWYLLKLRGIKSDMRFGTRHENGRFFAHAWVELDEHVLNDAQDISDQFIPFDGSIQIGLCIDN